MKTGQTIDFLRLLLLPVSWLFGMVTAVRNYCFDKGFIKSRTFDVPTICVGNITVGGTGKTPHVEYLIRLLHKTCEIAVVSRGYRRKTKALVIAGPNTSADEIGDEPFQIKKHFPFVRLAVNAKRCEAIDALLAQQQKPEIGVVLLDDAYQHRYVSAGLNVLLIDYNRPISQDHLLPAGMLRESRRGVRRADVIVVTKCPENMSENDRRKFIDRCLDFNGARDLVARDEVYFTKMSYAEPYKVFGGECATLSGISGKYAAVSVLAGIARPQPFIDEIAKFCQIGDTFVLPDHHDFTGSDLQRLERFVAEGDGRAVITTEKDAARLVAGKERLSSRLRENIYALPIKVEVMFDRQHKFDHKILGYVHENQGNC